MIRSFQCMDTYYPRTNKGGKNPRCTPVRNIDKIRKLLDSDPRMDLKIREQSFNQDP